MTVIRGYMRISRRTMESQSIDQQRAKIERWVSYHHPTVAVFCAYVDEGLSGAKEIRRPGRDMLLDEVSAGDVVAVTKVDRLARSVRDLLDIVKLVDERGASLVFIEQNIDTAGAFGRFMLTLLAAVAELEAAVVSERVREARATMKEQGRHIGRLPFGFRAERDPETGWLQVRPDPDEGPRLRESLLRVLAGGSQSEEARALGLPQPTFATILRNPRLRGLQPDGRVVKEAALLSASEWMQLLAVRNGPKGWSKAPGYGGALECYGCRGRLYYQKTDDRYQCAGGHPGRTSIKRPIADDFIEKVFTMQYGHLPELAPVRVDDAGERDEQLAMLDATLDEVMSALRGARGTERAALMEQMASLQDERDEVASRAPSGEVELVPTGRTERDRWDEASDAERTEVVRKYFKVVVYPRGSEARMKVSGRGVTATGPLFDS
jgi:DNA invertase Pin-like site-specific DNA recombinase